MTSHTVDIKISFTDLLAICFRKKKCLECEGQLRRRLDRGGEGPSWHSEQDGMSFDVSYGSTASIRVLYDCETCRRTYVPRELW